MELLEGEGVTIEHQNTVKVLTSFSVPLVDGRRLSVLFVAVLDGDLMVVAVPSKRSRKSEIDRSGLEIICDTSTMSGVNTTRFIHKMYQNCAC